MMKYILSMLLLGSCCSQIAAAQSTTSNVVCDYSQSTFNSSASVNDTSTSTWSCNNEERTLSANGLPDHPVGEFPNKNNPNTISAQTTSKTFTLNPVETDTATQLGGPRGAQGYILNGIKIDAGTAGSCDNAATNCSMMNPSGNWHIEALGHSSFDFGTDDNNAHVQPTGEYHYHGMPEGFIEIRGGGDSTMTLVGWATDGFPIYARYGYSDANDASSAIRAMTGSFKKLDTPLNNRPSVDTYEMGTFQEDWEYVAGSGDLDECNGRVGVTPDFPQGIYHYYATDTYPFFQRCVKGVVEARVGGDANARGAGNERRAGGRPDFEAAAAKLGVSQSELMKAIGGPPPNFEQASKMLGISAELIRKALRSQR